MANTTPAKVGKALSNAGFQSRRGAAWAHGFKASKFAAGEVAVTAHFSHGDYSTVSTQQREREALLQYATALTSAGFTVEDFDSTLFVS